MEFQRLSVKDHSKMRIGIIVSDFNEIITSRLLEGARHALLEAGIRSENIDIKRVAGAYEIPQAALRMAETGTWYALVALGCVIRGETSHYEIVANESTRGITAAAMSTGIPISLGILTTENTEQALDRSGGIHGNKGADASLAAVKMAILFQEIDIE